MCFFLVYDVSCHQVNCSSEQSSFLLNSEITHLIKYELWPSSKMADSNQDGWLALLSQTEVLHIFLWVPLWHVHQFLWWLVQLMPGAEFFFNFPIDNNWVSFGRVMFGDPTLYSSFQKKMIHCCEEGIERQRLPSKSNIATPSSESPQKTDNVIDKMV